MIFSLLLACAKPVPPPPPAPEVKVEITVVEEGEGEARVQDGSLASMHYRLTVDGAEVDSSYSRGVPLDFRVGEREVIRGWEEGVMGMRVGERRTLIVPPEKGYGSSGSGSIPPNAVLHFDVELVDTKDPRVAPVSPNWLDASALNRSETGLAWADLKPCGEGPRPQDGDSLRIDYSVFLPDGTLLTSTLSGYDPTQVVYGAGRVPVSVEEGLATMTAGCARQLRVPPEMGGGELGGVSMPATVVVFIEVELVEIL